MPKKGYRTPGDLNWLRRRLASGVDRPPEPVPEVLAAVTARDLDRLRRLLDAGADPNAVAANGLTPLGQAVVHGDVEAVSLLVERGADVNPPPANHAPRIVPALHLASLWGHTRIAQFLLVHGADPNAADSDGVLPLCRAIDRQQLELAWSLLDHGADVRQVCRDGTTALHAAMKGGHADLARALVAGGADPQARDDAGRSPIDVAVSTDTVVLGVAPDLDAADVAALVASQTAFATDVFARCVREGENLLLAPASIAAALSMLWAGTAGETHRELAGALRLPALDPARIHAAAGALATLCTRAPGVMLAMANALFMQAGGRIRRSFVDLVAAHYRAALHPVDFTQRAPTAAAVEEWVQTHTRGRITLEAGALFDDHTLLMLLNAIFFKGTWAHRFCARDTRNGPFFHLDGTSIPASFMYQHGSFSLAQIDGGLALDLPYESGAVSMVVLLPDRTDGLPLMERAMPDALPRWLVPLDVEREFAYAVDVYLPRFRLQTSLELGEALRALGVRVAFDPERADFSGLQERRDSEPPLYLQRAMHQTWIEVDEEGTTAAAVTGLGVMLGAQRPPPVFRADHPFLFLIRDRRTQSILFLGRVVTIPPDSVPA